VTQVQTFGNRSTEQSLRLLSLEHLGVIAARLRKDVTAPASEAENEELVEILAQVMQTKLDRGSPSPIELKRMVRKHRVSCMYLLNMCNVGHSTCAGRFL
jgi:cohesin loading factor subunit SCC2